MSSKVYKRASSLSCNEVREIIRNVSQEKVSDSPPLGMIANKNVSYLFTNGSKLNN